MCSVIRHAAENQCGIGRIDHVRSAGHVHYRGAHSTIAAVIIGRIRRDFTHVTSTAVASLGLHSVCPVRQLVDVPGSGASHQQQEGEKCRRLHGRKLSAHRTAHTTAHLKHVAPPQILTVGCRHMAPSEPSGAEV